MSAEPAPPTDVSDEAQVAAYLKPKVQLFPISVMARVDFVDVTSLLLEPAAFQFAVDALVHRYKSMGVSHVVSCEARGFIFGAPVALALKAAFVPVRRARTVPRNAVGVDYVSGFYSGRLEMQGDAIPAGARVVIIDDFVATGNTLKVIGELIELVGAHAVECGCVISTARLKRHPKQPLMAAPLLVVGSRLHWRNHRRDARLDVAALLAQVLAFCSRAASFRGSTGVAIAVGVPEEVAALPPRHSEPRSAFSESVDEFLQQLHAAVASGVRAPDGRTVPVEIVSMLHWGRFVPALNALISTAATVFPEASTLLLQSLEVEADADALQFLCSHFDERRDLVVGAALPGHAFSPSKDGQPLELTGTTTPWNTLALWNLRQLSKVGFPLIGDGLHVDGECAGVEEVSTIATYQQLFGEHSTRATVLHVPGIAWQVGDFDDPKRREWQASKMASKNQRAAKQMERLGVAAGRVYHLDTSASS